MVPLVCLVPRYWYVFLVQFCNRIYRVIVLLKLLLVEFVVETLKSEGVKPKFFRCFLAIRICITSLLINLQGPKDKVQLTFYRASKLTKTECLHAMMI